MLAILADDLTGALDSAAPFAGRGLHTEVALSRDSIVGIVEDRPDVLSINLNTREIGADEARAATAAVMALLPIGTQLFKKVDSRLKGNIVAELDAIPFRQALVAPAIPEFERIVEDGRVTGFGIDTPIVITNRLGPHAARAHAPNTRTPADMDAVLAAAESDGTDLLIGARGLAEALARRMTAGISAQAATIPPGRITFVIGSRDPITLKQIDALRGSHSLNYLPAPNGTLGAAPDTGTDLTLVQATPAAEELDPQLVSEALADGLNRNFAGYDGTLLLSGGATAEAVLRRLGLSRLRLHGECLPGLGVASAQGRCIIAKSGGFGHPDTLKHIADMVLRKAG
ncbi:four-carbon acid sugar kinase family protein [Aliirhizobium smilacinae]|uniref:Four-carbon acid sugar kinase family protein n=1 Tax=Aliirhizobium smilacinae TaxID=1395944 RepID=A0A5C4XM07_9HYPH|nr:four-carbon acid sugar kinase family protein [Rhizobium smilacinae]TNM63504.1 four-carbon acid sugar kinase family protein [Rhizobium smilacinae]